MEINILSSHNNISKTEKLKEFGLDENSFKKQTKDKLLDISYNKIVELNNKLKENEKIYQNPKSKRNVKKPKTYQNIDKTDDKYKLVLEFLNALLVVIGKPQIDDITKFQNIKREDLLKQECTQVLNNYLDRLVKEFGKSTLLYSKRHKIDTYLLTIIKSIVLNWGYQFKSYQKHTSKQISDNLYDRNYWMVYTIS